MVRVAIASVVLFFFSAVAHAEKRAALVIGNSAYKHSAELINPKHDADDMAFVLKALGIEVIQGLDLDKRGFEQQVRKFSAALSEADVGIFFYSGHGLQVNGHNYLVPIDAELSTADALEFEMIRLDVVQHVMEEKAKVNILFLDACRNNPLARNLARALGTRSASIGKGLAPAESGVGTLISFSTQPGNVAFDGTGRNSPYTGPLVKRIGSPGQDILTILTDVRNEVLAATGDKQVPWENHALRARFYFNHSGSTSSIPVARLSEAAEAWDRVRQATTIASLEAYVARYNDTFYADLARIKIEELKSISDIRTQDGKPFGSARAIGLFTERDAERVTAIVKKHQLVSPTVYDFVVPDDDRIPQRTRKLLGVWASVVGYGGTGRQAMLILTEAIGPQTIKGFLLSGPPTGSSFSQAPASFQEFEGTLVGDTLSWGSATSLLREARTAGTDFTLTDKWANGNRGSVTLKPVWRLVEGEERERKLRSRNPSTSANK